MVFGSKGGSRKAPPLKIVDPYIVEETCTLGLQPPVVAVLSAVACVYGVALSLRGCAMIIHWLWLWLVAAGTQCTNSCKQACDERRLAAELV